MIVLGFINQDLYPRLEHEEWLKLGLCKERCREKQINSDSLAVKS